jgi:ABC-type bacteriocin/lantibiotic exporter with double-glycine peptidase domain
MRYLDVTLEPDNQPSAETTVNSGKTQQGEFRDLVVSSVSFSYENSGRDALKDICLRVSAGESIGLIGTSGAGKTTLVDVLLGLLEPQCGEILYNGEALSLVMSKWRGQVAYLPQQIFLIDDTLRRNVALGESDDLIDEDRLLGALRQARLVDLVEELPSGVNTVIGERGVRLSGGQRQRVALARAFYHGRNVLVMDEATSALDNDTEKEIVSEIQRLKGLKTMIVIATGSLRWSTAIGFTSWKVGVLLQLERPVNCCASGAPPGKLACPETG